MLGAGVVLGLGLGMVMQVLVLAVQNAVDPRQMGVATSGSTLFRQIGGSIGVSIFGAIFANQLHSELASRFPAGATAPRAGDPGAIRALPPGVRSLFEQAFAAALHPVFLMAAAVSLVAFALTWLIPALPLRESVAEVPEVPPGAEPVTPRPKPAQKSWGRTWRPSQSGETRSLTDLTANVCSCRTYVRMVACLLIPGFELRAALRARPSLALVPLRSRPPRAKSRCSAR